MKRFFKPVRIRERLLRDLAIVILLTTGVITAVTLLQGADMRTKIAEERVRQGLEETSLQILRFFEPVSQNALLIQKWGVAGLWEMENSGAITEKLVPVLENLPQVTAIKMGAASGHSYLIAKENNTWTIRTRTPERPKTILVSGWAGDLLKENQTMKTDRDFTQSPWYQEGIPLREPGPDGVSWTSPYLFSYNKTPGLSAVLSWTGKKKTEEKTVLAVDIALKDLFSHILHQDIGHGGAAFLFDGDTAVYAPSPEPSDAPVFTVHHKKAPDLRTRHALAAWHAAGMPSRAFSFVADGKISWAGVAPVISGDQKVWIGVVFPESAFSGNISRKRGTLLVIALGIFAFGMGMAGILVWKYRHQLRDIPHQSIRNSHFSEDIYRLITRGEGGSLEFKSTMRWNLKTEKTDKNIEMAWLKTVAAFMNTDGGIILIGVSDEGEIVGTKPDAFENEDKALLHFRNLIKQHIGLEFTKNIHFSMGCVEEKIVMAIECERAGEPVFLIHKKDEFFYVRSGPSSVSLTMRQMLKYLQSQK